MIISEIVEKLEKAKLQYGDVEVTFRLKFNEQAHSYYGYYEFSDDDFVQCIDQVDFKESGDVYRFNRIELTNLKEDV